MPTRLREGPDRLVVGAAHRLTRRRLLRGAAGTALGASMGLAFLDKVMVDPAYAITCFNRPEECGVACKRNDLCGPSPPCGSNHCMSNGQCKDENEFGTRYRYYTESTCEQPIDNKQNCWCSCSSNGKMRRCCDCCQKNSTGVDARCTSCPNGQRWYKCVCGVTICDNCC